MRKTIVFILAVGVAAAVLMAAGCKPRNAKMKALLLSPPAVVNCSVSGTFQFDYGEDVVFWSDDYPLSSVQYSDCELYSTQRVFRIDVTQNGQWFHVRVDNCEGNSRISLRRNCDPADTSEENVFCGSIENYYCDETSDIFISEGIPVGTYYLVVSTDGDYGIYFNIHECGD